MQHLAINTTQTTQATYTSLVIKNEAIQKIILFTAMLACFVVAVNI